MISMYTYTKRFETDWNGKRIKGHYLEVMVEVYYQALLGFLRRQWN